MSQNSVSDVETSDVQSGDLRDRILICIVGFLSSLLLRAIARTLRWRRVGLDLVPENWSAGEPVIIVFWHAHQLLMPWVYLFPRGLPGRRPIGVLISQHRDGRMIASAMNFLGLESVAGSSTRGGREALFALIRRLQSGSHIAVTPDGPKGPPRKVKSGVIRIAQRSGAPMIPCAIIAERQWTFRSWDKMILPKPFSPTVLITGEPIRVPAELGAGEVERYAERLEAALNAIGEKAERSLAEAAGP